MSQWSSNYVHTTLARYNDPQGNIHELDCSIDGNENLILNHKVNGLADSRNDRSIPIQLVLNYDKLVLKAFQKYLAEDSKQNDRKVIS